MKFLLRTLALGVLTLNASLALNASLGAAEPAASSPAATGSQPAVEDISKEDISKISEAFGHFIGRNLNTPGVKLDVEAVIKGIRDGAAGKPAPLSDKEYEEKMLQLQKVAYNRLAEQNMKAANDYLKDNATKTDIVVVEPGKLQYQILEKGNGAEVKASSNPMINYTGKYIDGTTFGASSEMGGPISIPLDQTIPGFSKGIQGMKEGEKRRLFVHPDLGYGTLGNLPPNSLLIFDIEVVKADSPRSSNNEDEDLLPLIDDEDDLDADSDADSLESKPASKTDQTAPATKK